MSAIIFNHPRHEVKLDDPKVADLHLATRERIDAAYRDNCAQRAALNIPLLPEPDTTEEQFRALEGHEAVYRLVQLHGSERVGHWLKTAAMIHEGREVN